MIVVGIDGSQESEGALRWALEEARLRGDGVHVIHAWAFPAAAAMIEPHTADLLDPGP